MYVCVCACICTRVVVFFVLRRQARVRPWTPCHDRDDSGEHRWYESAVWLVFRARVVVTRMGHIRAHPTCVSHGPYPCPNPSPSPANLMHGIRPLHLVLTKHTISIISTRSQACLHTLVTVACLLKPFRCAASMLLIRVGAALNTRTYDRTMEVVGGKTGLHAFQAIMITSRIGSLLGTCIVVGAFITDPHTLALVLRCPHRLGCLTCPHSPEQGAQGQ